MACKKRQVTSPRVSAFNRENPQHTPWTHDHSSARNFHWCNPLQRLPIMHFSLQMYNHITMTTTSIEHAI